MNPEDFDHKALESLLWQEWLDTKAVDIKHKLVEFYYDWCFELAQNVLHSMKNPSIEFMDVFHTATLGLLESIDRYDPKNEKSKSFKYFARLRIRGAIVDELDKTQKPYRCQSLAANNDLAENPTPTDQPVEQLVNFVNQLLIEDFLVEQAIPTIDEHYTHTLQAYESKQITALQESVHQALSRLSTNEATILRYYYYHHLSQDEIALIMAMSKSRISQLHKQALKHLYHYLRHWNELS
ncbi:MAG: sigma-70 family RNA polymerase sigma factor [Pseudomonadota bacterium]